MTFQGLRVLFHFLFELWTVFLSAKLPFLIIAKTKNKVFINTLQSKGPRYESLHKKWSFPIRISSVQISFVQWIWKNTKNYLIPIAIWRTYFGALPTRRMVIRNQWQIYLINSMTFQFDYLWIIWYKSCAFDKSIKLYPQISFGMHLFAMNEETWITHVGVLVALDKKRQSLFTFCSIYLKLKRHSVNRN